ncbi:Fe-Mn family superoxide dismutase [Paenibacillus assamensis]|uniref:Fe-Mn family superoxide dismutase n=1 Tax=Paenibacillus assamensis TaxID=311244 RepID=UPI0003FD0F97|nr:Fe-Mn family superoxide dismutase [Paenibacillus assamensis]
MLLIYGPYMPIRILEAIQDWKNQEKEHAVLIRSVVPELEPSFSQVLTEWEHVFAKTEETARGWLHNCISSDTRWDNSLLTQIDQLLGASVQQSEHFIQQLEHIKQYSQAVRYTSAAPLLCAHVVRESYVFVSVTKSLTSTPLAEAQANAAAYGQGPAAAYHSAAVRPNDVTAAIGSRPAQSQACAAGEAIPPQSERPPNGAGAMQHGTAHAPHAAALQHGSPYSPQAAASQHNSPYSPQGSPYAPQTAASAQPAAASEPQLRQAAPEEARPADNVYVPPGGHRLPPLPYPYNALEPYIDTKTMQIHHDIHHKAYVDDLNKAELALVEARRTGNFDQIKALERDLAFNGAGHYLHTIFWDVMNPKGGGEPQGDLRRQIEQDFGSYQAFKQQFSKAAEKVEGGGWALLVWSPRSRRLEILQAEKHQNLSQWDVIPLLVLDVWEHAYYLKHQSKRADYIKDWWNVVYWPAVNERYLKARQLKWAPF